MNAEGSWPRHVPPVRVRVPCQGSEHTVSWKRGSLVLEDHDVTADEVVIALGGAAPACLELRRSWRLGYIEQAPPTERAALVRSLSSLARWMSGGGDHPAVLPEPLRRLREASVLHTWGRGLREHASSERAQREFLERAVARRVRDLLVRQLRSIGGEGNRDVAVVVGEEVVVHGRCEGTVAVVRVQVPARWLTRVWVGELETWRGDVVLDVADRRASALALARWLPDGEGGHDLALVHEHT